MRTVKMRDYNEIDFILKNEVVNVDEKTKDGATALFIAFDDGRLDIIKLIVNQHEANINLKSHRLTALDIDINTTTAIKNHENMTHKRISYINEHGEAT